MYYSPCFPEKKELLSRSVARCKNCYYYCIKSETCKINYPKPGVPQPHMEPDDWCGQFEKDEDRMKSLGLISNLKDGILLPDYLAKAIIRDLDELSELVKHPVKNRWGENVETPNYRNETFHIRHDFKAEGSFGGWSSLDDFGNAPCTCRYSYYLDGKEVPGSLWCYAYLKEFDSFPPEPSRYDDYLEFCKRWYVTKTPCRNCMDGQHLPRFRFVSSFSNLDLDWSWAWGKVVIANRKTTLAEWRSIYNICKKSIANNPPKVSSPPET